MASKQADGRFIVSAGELGVYSVCPESWRLRYVEKKSNLLEVKKDKAESQKLGDQLHLSWVQHYEELFTLQTALRCLFAFSCAAVVAWLTARSPRESLQALFSLGISANILELVMVLMAAGFVALGVSRSLVIRGNEGGLGAIKDTIGLDGSKILPGREYISSKLGLAGKPDALLVEDGFVIPVERKPLARKLRDRYIAQLLVYMKLVEEFEGKKPPFGYLILGSECKRVKIEFTDSRSDWCTRMLSEMQDILKTGSLARTDPHVNKCAKCEVKSVCREFADKPIRISSGTGRVKVVAV